MATSTSASAAFLRHLAAALAVATCQLLTLAEAATAASAAAVAPPSTRRPPRGGGQGGGGGVTNNSLGGGGGGDGGGGRGGQEDDGDGDGYWTEITVSNDGACPTFTNWWLSLCYTRSHKKTDTLHLPSKKYYWKNDTNLNRAKQGR